MAYAAMAYIVIAHIVEAYIVMAYTGMAYIVMAYTLMAFIVMAPCTGAGVTTRDYARFGWLMLNEGADRTVTCRHGLRHRRRHVYYAGMDVPVLKMPASPRRSF